MRTEPIWHDLMTEEEHELVASLGRCAGSFRRIMHRRDSRVAIADVGEAVDKIHQLQNMVLAQAAARAYPERYRLMGQMTTVKTIDELKEWADTHA